jgi:hypothetical protein
MKSFIFDITFGSRIKGAYWQIITTSGREVKNESCQYYHQQRNDSQSYYAYPLLKAERGHLVIICGCHMRFTCEVGYAMHLLI